MDFVTLNAFLCKKYKHRVVKKIIIDCEREIVKVKVEE